MKQILKPKVRDPFTRLAVRMKRGDAHAAQELYDELADKVFGFCMNRVGDRATAEDLTQEIFLKFVDKLHLYNEKEGRFLVWFWRLARNTVIDHYRSKKQTVFGDMGDEFVESIPGEGNIDHTIDVRFAHENLIDFMNTLSREEQHIFELRYISELSYAEISEMLGKSEGGLRVAISRLKSKLKEHFPRS